MGKKVGHPTPKPDYYHEILQETIQNILKRHIKGGITDEEYYQAIEMLWEPSQAVRAKSIIDAYMADKTPKPAAPKLPSRPIVPPPSPKPVPRRAPKPKKLPPVKTPIEEPLKEAKLEKDIHEVELEKDKLSVLRTDLIDVEELLTKLRHAPIPSTATDEVILSIKLDERKKARNDLSNINGYIALGIARPEQRVEAEGLKNIIEELSEEIKELQDKIKRDKDIKLYNDRLISTAEKEKDKLEKGLKESKQKLAKKQEKLEFKTKKEQSIKKELEQLPHLKRKLKHITESALLR